MIKTFIKIKESRIRLTNIKRYQPHGDKKLIIYYNTSRSKIENETFAFESKASREEVLDLLDISFGIMKQ